MTDAAVLELISQLEDKRYEAMLSSDIGTLDQLMSDSGFVLHSTTNIDTKVIYLDSLRTGQLKYHAIERSGTERILFGDMVAYVRGRVRADVTVGDKELELDNFIVAVWVLEDDHWRMASAQSTPLPK